MDKQEVHRTKYIITWECTQSLAWEYLDTVYPDFKMSCEKVSLYPKEIPKCGQDNSTVR